MCFLLGPTEILNCSQIPLARLSQFANLLTDVWAKVIAHVRQLNWFASVEYKRKCSRLSFTNGQSQWVECSNTSGPTDLPQVTRRGECMVHFSELFLCERQEHTVAPCIDHNIRNMKSGNCVKLRRDEVTVFVISFRDKSTRRNIGHEYVAREKFFFKITGFHHPAPRTVATLLACPQRTSSTRKHFV